MTKVHESGGVRQEAQDISGAKVLWVALLVIAVGVGAIGAMAWLLDERREELQPDSAPPIGASVLRAVPLEHSRIERDARGLELQAAARRRLDEWGWVVPGEVARIPIAEATHWFLSEAQPERGPRAPSGPSSEADSSAGGERLGVSGADRHPGRDGGAESRTGAD